MSDPERGQALEDYKKSLLELREWEAKLKGLRLGIKDLQREFDVSEDNIKALQSVGQIIGEVLKQLDEERCEYSKCHATCTGSPIRKLMIPQSLSRRRRVLDMSSAVGQRWIRPR